jgi:hypothetical protein
MFAVLRALNAIFCHVTSSSLLDRYKPFLGIWWLQDGKWKQKDASKCSCQSTGPPMRPWQFGDICYLQLHGKRGRHQVLPKHWHIPNYTGSHPKWTWGFGGIYYPQYQMENWVSKLVRNVGGYPPNYMMLHDISEEPAASMFMVYDRRGGFLSV